ncbi:hypothetical protein BDQ17DRAFT_1212259, partial [Cyathus striatus]
LEVEDGLSIDNLTHEVFSLLGDNGIIRSADKHTCSECTHAYRRKSNAISDNEYAPVKMVVLDGIMMGPTHCAFEECTSELHNARGGVFCEVHEAFYGACCRVQGCNNMKKQGTQACNNHQEEWRRFQSTCNTSHHAGVRRMLQ